MKRKIIYIAGYGRSGSTILGSVLGAHPRVVHAGELYQFPGIWESAYLCACGRPYPDCEFWGALFENRPPSLSGAEVRRVEGTAGLVRLAAGRISGADARRYRDFQERILGYISDRERGAIVVDSSKTARYAAGRPLALRKISAEDVRMIHLVRNGLDSTASLVLKGSNRRLENRDFSYRFASPRSVIGWTQANLSASGAGKRLGPDRYMRLKYEDLIHDPESALNRIGVFLGMDFGGVSGMIRSGAAFEVGHPVGGNRLRLDGQVRIDPEPRPSGRADLPVVHRVLFTLAAGWLNRLYGYKSSP